MISYETKEIDEVLRELNTSKDGLSSTEAQKRLEENGRNEIKEKKKKSWFKIFL